VSFSHFTCGVLENGEKCRVKRLVCLTRSAISVCILIANFAHTVAATRIEGLLAGLDWAGLFAGNNLLETLSRRLTVNVNPASEPETDYGPAEVESHT